MLVTGHFRISASAFRFCQNFLILNFSFCLCRYCLGSGFSSHQKPDGTCVETRWTNGNSLDKIGVNGSQGANFTAGGRELLQIDLGKLALDSFQKHVTQTSVEPFAIKRRHQFVEHAFAYYLKSKGKIVS